MYLCLQDKNFGNQLQRNPHKVKNDADKDWANSNNEVEPLVSCFFKNLVEAFGLAKTKQDKVQIVCLEHIEV